MSVGKFSVVAESEPGCCEVNLIFFILTLAWR